MKPGAALKYWNPRAIAASHGYYKTAPNVTNIASTTWGWLTCKLFLGVEFL